MAPRIVPVAAALPQVVDARRLPAVARAALAAALHQTFRLAFQSPVAAALASLPAQGRPDHVAAALPGPPAEHLPATHAPGLPAAPAPALPAAPPAAGAASPASARAASAPLSASVTASLAAVLRTLAATGDPGAYRFVMQIMREEHRAVMQVLDAWGESLRAQAKLSKRAHDLAARQVVAALRACRRHIDRSKIRHLQLRGGGGPTHGRLVYASIDGWGRESGEVFGVGLVPERTQIRPGLRPSPPLPLEDVGGVRLRGARRP